MPVADSCLSFSPSLKSRFRRNREALQQRQPVVADAVGSTPMTEGVRAATGRDGSETAQWRDDSGAWAWFGHSSMPTISASETFAHVQCGSESVVIPGILTGAEPLVLAGRLPKHAAIFVLEDSPLQLSLALHLHDYAQLIEDGRLVFIMGPDFAISMCRLYDSYPGYELPRTLLKVPQRTPAQFADLQRRLEAACVRAAGVLQRKISQYTVSLQGMVHGALRAKPGVTVIGIDPRPESLEFATAIERAAAGCDWPTRISVPTAPDHCHAIVRMAAIAEHNPDFVLVASGTAGGARASAPEGLSFVYWFGPHSVLPAHGAEAPRPQDLALVSTSAQRDALLARSWPSVAIHPLGFALDDALLCPTRLGPADRKAFGADVALLADMPNADAATCGFTLTSHVQLWDSFRAVVTQAVRAGGLPALDRLFERAQQQSSVQLADAALRSRFLALARDRLVPAVIARAVCESLSTLQLSVGIWGSGWNAEDFGNPRQRAFASEGSTSGDAGGNRQPLGVNGPVPVGRARFKLYHAVDHVVLLDDAPLSVLRGAEAFACGCAVHMHGHLEVVAGEVLGVEGVLPQFQWRTNVAALHERLTAASGRILAGGETRGDCVARRRQAIQPLTITSRLARIHELLRRANRTSSP